jgi:hypothetical protein
MYVLSISVLPNNLGRPFFMVESDFRWIYAVSTNFPLLDSFRNKVIAFTNHQYLPFINIEIVSYESLSENEITNNFYNPYETDKFYIEGIVNNRINTNRNLSVSFDEFTPDKWDI